MDIPGGTVGPFDGLAARDDLGDEEVDPRELSEQEFQQWMEREELSNQEQMAVLADRLDRLGSLTSVLHQTFSNDSPAKLKDALVRESAVLQSLYAQGGESDGKHTAHRLHELMHDEWSNVLSRRFNLPAYTPPPPIRTPQAMNPLDSKY